MPPGPFPLPLIGSLYILPLTDLSQTLFVFSDLRKKYGDMFTNIWPNGRYVA